MSKKKTEASQFQQECNDPFLDGITSQVNLLLKIIQDHKDVTDKNMNDGRKKIREAIMLTILENIKHRVQRCQFKLKTSPSSSTSSSSNSDENKVDEKEKLRQELEANRAAIKRLRSESADLVIEKRKILAEMINKDNLVKQTIKHVNDLKARRQVLKNKVEKCASEHKDKEGFDLAAAEKLRHDVLCLERENHTLKHRLVNTEDKTRLMHKEEKRLQKINKKIHEKMEEITNEVESGLEKFTEFKQTMASTTHTPPPPIIQHEIKRLDQLFHRLQLLNSNLET